VRPGTHEHSAGEVVIAVEGLAVAYDGRAILKDVSFELHDGETLVIVGSSGCGKSTLLRCLVGLLAPSEGRISILGKDLSRLSADEMDALRREMGVGFQSAALFGSMTIAENVALPLKELTDLDDSTIGIMTRLKLEHVGLGGYEAFLPSRLSGGMKKRASIARAIAMDPRFLFLDEPSAGLDPITAAGLDGLLTRLRTALGLTLVVVTHELESAFAIADRMLMLDGGVVRIQGTPEEVRACTDPRVRQFFDRKADVETTSGRLADELLR
jgi:phospholipid/cholesterol/gamma-HCH transport system ATP-binding protein